MPTLRFFLLLIAMQGPGAIIARAANCNNCNIVSTYGMQGFDVGGTYQLRDGSIVIVEDVDFRYGGVLVQFRSTGERRWIDARQIYGVLMIPRSNSPDDSQRKGLIAACAALADARAHGNTALALLMQGACCESTAAKVYPQISGPLCN